MAAQELAVANQEKGKFRNEIQKKDIFSQPGLPKNTAKIGEKQYTPPLTVTDKSITLY